MKYLILLCVFSITACGEAERKTNNGNATGTTPGFISVTPNDPGTPGSSKPINELSDAEFVALCDTISAPASCNVNGDDLDWDGGAVCDTISEARSRDCDTQSSVVIDCRQSVVDCISFDDVIARCADLFEGPCSGRNDPQPVGDGN